MIKSTIGTTKWLLSLTFRLLKGAPKTALTVISLSLLSQALTMIAFLLPLKVVMLLNSPTIPQFFPDTYSQLDRDSLVIYLGAIAMVCFILLVFVNRGVKSTARLGASQLLMDAQKITSLPNQNKLAFNAYLKHSELLSNLVFAALAFAILFYLYIDLTIVLLAYLVFTSVLMALISFFGPTFYSRLTKTPQNIIYGISNTGFFTMFIFVVADFLYFTPPAFFIALFSIILTRRLLSSLSVFLNKSISLDAQKDTINAIFFHNKPLLLPTKKRQQSLLELLSPGYRKKWVKDIIMESVTDNPGRISTQWLQTQEVHVLMIKVFLGHQNRHFLIKLFDKNSSHLSTHEASLLAKNLNSLPALPLLKTTKVATYPCHLFEVTGYEFITKKPLQNESLILQKELLGVHLPQPLQQQYKRSKQLLWQRVDASTLSRLSTIATAEQSCLIHEIRDLFPTIRNTIKSLPLSLFLPPETLKRGAWLIDSSGKLCTTSWANWAIEPIGYGWKTNEESFEKLRVALEHTSHSLPHLKTLNFDYVKLASLLSAFEKAMDFSQYHDAILLLKKMLKIIKHSDN